MTRPVSNFPLAYKLSWLPRLLRPSPGSGPDFLPAEATLLPRAAATTRRLAFLGDISAVANRAVPEVDQRLRSLLASADLVIGNCESPVVERRRHPLRTAAGTRHAMTPRFLAAAIDAAGIAPERLLLSLANNHALDQGGDGYAETREALAGLGIRTIGGSEDGLARTVELDGLRIAFAAFTQWRNTGRAEFAGRINMLDDIAGNDFAALRYNEADHLCVVAHWDREFRHRPQASTRALARALAESGVDLVAGHHAHVLQPAERAGDTLVAYGLGDFLGTVLPRVPWPLRLGAVLSADISGDDETKGKVSAYRIVPFVRERASGRERLLMLEEAGASATKLRERFAAIFPASRSTRTPGLASTA